MSVIANKSASTTPVLSPEPSPELSPVATPTLYSESNIDDTPYYSNSDSDEENIPLLDMSPKQSIKDLQSMPFFRVLLYLIRYSAPVIASYLLQASIPAASVLFLSHQSAHDLAAAALGNTFASVTGWSLALGMATSLDTLCSQAFTGSGSDITKVGVYLQRGLLVSLTLFIPIQILWFYSEIVLVKVLFLPADMAASTNIYLRYLILGAPAYSGFECVKKFLQAQGIMTASTTILLLASPIHILVCFFLIHHPATSLGFIGAPVSQVITMWIMFILICLYAIFINGSQAWGGWSTQAFLGWGLIIKLGLPGMAMICADWWAFEIAALAASHLGTFSLAAHSILATASNFNYMGFHGLGIASSCLIGNYLGQNRPQSARVISRCALLLSFIISFFTGMVLMIFRHQIAELASNDTQVIGYVASILPLVAFNQLFDGLATVSGGLLRGQGRQMSGALFNFVGFYFIGLPLGGLLAFKVNLALTGLWLGIVIGLCFIAVSLTCLNLFTNWKNQVRKCKLRLANSN